jgi:nucleolar protein 15
MGKENKQKKKEEEVVEKEKPIRKVKTKKTSKTSKRLDKLEKGKVENADTRGIIYVGHLPYGFDEAGLRQFFEQFGKILKIKLFRSQKVFLCNK